MSDTPSDCERVDIDGQPYLIQPWQGGWLSFEYVPDDVFGCLWRRIDKRGVDPKLLSREEAVEMCRWHHGVRLAEREMR